VAGPISRDLPKAAEDRAVDASDAEFGFGRPVDRNGEIAGRSAGAADR
jgi:hypothetical protein